MPLVLIAVSVSFLPNLFLILFIVNQYFIRSRPLYSVSVGSIELFLTIFAITPLFLTIRTSRVKHKNFKDTKVITFFVALMTVALTVNVPTSITLLEFSNDAPRHNPAAIAVQTIMSLAMATVCQLVLFTPKLFPVICEKFSPQTHTPLTSTTATLSTAVLQVTKETMATP